MCKVGTNGSVIASPVHPVPLSFLEGARVPMCPFKAVGKLQKKSTKVE